MYRWLDRASEAAEVVDAFYDALPDKVKKRWKCGSASGSPLAHQAGQYGIDQADCKLRALYHNIDEVDVTQAFKNVVKNQLEDKFIGWYQSRAPKNLGSAVEDGEKAFAKALDKVFEGLGL